MIPAGHGLSMPTNFVWFSLVGYLKGLEVLSRARLEFLRMNSVQSMRLFRLFVLLQCVLPIVAFFVFRSIVTENYSAILQNSVVTQVENNVDNNNNDSPAESDDGNTNNTTPSEQSTVLCLLFLDSFKLTFEALQSFAIASEISDIHRTNEKIKRINEGGDKYGDLNERNEVVGELETALKRRIDKNLTVKFVFAR